MSECCGIAAVFIEDHGRGPEIFLRIATDDGSIRAVHWTLDAIVEMSGEIEPPIRAPTSVGLQ